MICIPTSEFLKIIESHTNSDANYDAYYEGTADSANNEEIYVCREHEREEKATIIDRQST